MFFGLKKLASRSVIGIDFGSSSIKAIAISKGSGAYRVDGIAEAPVAKGLIVDNRFEEVDKITAILKQIRHSFPSSYKNVAIAVTGSDVITKVMKMNASLGELDLESRVEIEVENSIPFPLDEIFIDFEIMGPSENDKSLNDILVSAARKERVLSQAQCVDDSGLKTTIVDIASHALARSAEMIMTSDDYNRGVAVVDIGATQMMLNILYQGNVIFTRSKSHGGGLCNQMLSERYGMPAQEAEQAKINQDLPDGAEIDVITPFVNMTVNHLRFDLRMFTNAPNNVDVQKLILTGGGVLMPALAKQLQDELEFEVEIADPSLALECKSEEDSKLLKESGAKYMMALGLALRGVS
ncbi:type IV pilus assembly protein PilM [Psychromonas sp. KJ10-2]|uniref:type IV pilus assembly protein PilM n=1 Tax=Psychromonas sp. KJ10-2 TaxID=3391822 RepID=UPI0039B3A17A